MSDEQQVLFRATGSVGIVEINRPDKFNCVSEEVLDGILAALDAFLPDRAIRSLLLCSVGKNFCTGADLAQVLGRIANDDFGAFGDKGHRVLRHLETCDLPVVAAVQGLALAGGLELMLACDVVFAAASARIGDQHAQYGLVPGWGGSQRLPRIVGPRRALDLMYSARWIGADEAQAWGLVNYVVADDQLREQALAYCETLGSRSRGGLAVMKRLCYDGLERTLEDGLELEAKVAADAMQSDDTKEGLAAFQERREPRFG